MFLIDTSIIAAADPKGRNIPATLKQWLVRASDRLFLSVITIAEIERDATSGERGAARIAWLELLRHLYRDRFLPLDFDTARLSGSLLDKALRQGGTVSFEDAAIAATARRSGLTILATQDRHFHLMDVAYINPDERLPDL